MDIQNSYPYRAGLTDESESGLTLSTVDPDTRVDPESQEKVLVIT